MDVSGNYAQQQLFNDLAKAFQRGARLLHGGLAHIQDQPVARFFLSIPAEDAGLVSLVAGLPLGRAFVMTGKGGLAENLRTNRILGAVINAFHSVPFIILPIALIPSTRLIVGTALGTWAAIVPLAIAATPYHARIAGVSMREVDRGLIEAVRAMGGNRWTIIREVLIPESLPRIVAGFTVTLVTLIGASAMAGAIGTGGLGDLAIHYGYQRFETGVMIAVVFIIMVLVCGIQWVGDRMTARIHKRN